MSVIPFPRRQAPRSTIPGERAAHDVAADFAILVRARLAGVEPSAPGSLRASLVRMAARTLLEIDDADRRATQ